MSVNSISSLAKTPLDYIAQGYWQDFLTAQPIAGGIAYEAQLLACHLDESLISLQRVDTLITQIRRDISKSAHLNEGAILADEGYRNLLLFLAFYAGRVLANQWQSAPQWYGQFEIEKHYPDLTLTADDFYQQMAMVYDAVVDDNHAGDAQARLFFALEPIGLRLFGSIDRQFVAVQGGQVASGLYQAVSMLMPDSGSDKTNRNQQKQFVQAQPTAPIVALESTDMAAEPMAAVLTKSTPKPIIIKTVTNQEIVQQPIAAAPVAEHTPTVKSDIRVKSIAVTPDIFSQLLIELNAIEVPQTAAQTEYQQACKILDQFERHIAKQHKLRAQVSFSSQHQSARLQALGLLKQSANAGNSAAMLRLAMYELLNEGLEDNETAAQEAGVIWVKQAAERNDPRAQRLLSKMYYQGIGVAQDMSNGQLWLTQAADNGHAEAAQLVAEWQQAQALMSTQKQEQHSIKRYQLLLAIIGVASLLLMMLV